MMRNQLCKGRQGLVSSSNLSLLILVCCFAVSTGLTIPVSKVTRPTTALNVAQSDLGSSLDEDTESLPPKGKDVQYRRLPRNLKSSNIPPGSPLNSICNDEEAFELHVGRALNSLRNDYPRILREQPDLTIFDKEVEVIDPSGVKLHGIKNYKNAFRFMHGILNLFYCPERSLMTFRMCYDSARQNIRVHWNAEVVPKKIFGGLRTTLHADGISVYEISRESGLITQHRIERLLINDVPLRPQQGIFALLRNEHDERVPVFSVFESPTKSIAEFKVALPDILVKLSGRPTSLFAMDGDSIQDEYPGLDIDAYDRKNASRKKFGLEPLTPEEFLEIELQVQRMASQQQASAASAVTETKPRKNIFDNFFGNLAGDTCESNFDCQRPEVCCDLGVKKMCCSGGAFVGRALEPALIPVVQGIEDMPF